MYVCTDLQVLYGEPYIVTEIKRSKLQCLEHMKCMEGSNHVQKIYVGKPQGQWNIVRARKTWLGLHRMGVREVRKRKVIESDGYNFSRRPSSSRAVVSWSHSVNMYTVYTYKYTHTHTHRMSQNSYYTLLRIIPKCIGEAILHTYTQLHLVCPD